MRSPSGTARRLILAFAGLLSIFAVSSWFALSNLREIQGGLTEIKELEMVPSGNHDADVADGATYVKRSTASTLAANPSTSAAVGSCSHTSNASTTSAYFARWPGRTTTRMGTSGRVILPYRRKIARC